MEREKILLNKLGRDSQKCKDSKTGREEEKDVEKFLNVAVN